MTEKGSGFCRLPKSVIPINYNLWLKPSLEEFVFDGKVDIEVEVVESVSEIVLNSTDITISSATFCQQDNTMVESGQVVFEVAEERVAIKFNIPLEIGCGVLSLHFKGNLNDQMKGFYRTRYILDGETRYGAVTQFEAAHARRCFPCWDEPALKATFDVTLVVPKDRVALSNMNIVSEDNFDDSNCKEVKYARTPIMSTYLLAIAIGEFDFVEGKSPQGLPIRVNTPKGKASQGRFALDVAVKALSYYEDYFGIPYPLPKMDLVAIADFGGAMENWGLITYRESVLLIDVENSSAQTHQLVCIVVCHELAHQWFGNLVTMEWWTHLWLNEGFASFIAYLATDHCHPEFDIWTQFLSTDLKRGMDLDALMSSHPIESPIGHPDQIGEIFDAISYCKGASILRMLYNWIGDKCFREAMHNYLNQYAYKNAVTEDLWDALNKSSGKPVERVMTSWIKQMGFPVLSVTIVSRGENYAALRISQKKFNANEKASVDSSLKWSIPVAFSTSVSPSEPVTWILMEGESAEVTLKNVSHSSWIKVNPGTYGFYRVQYDSNLLQALLPAIRTKSLPARDRLGLENDLFALALSGVSPTTDFLDALCAYESEKNYAVWSDLDSNVGSLSVLLWRDEAVYEKFKTFILKHYKGVSTSLGWDLSPGEGHLNALLKSLIIRRVGRFGCTKTITEAENRFNAHLCNKGCIHADLRFAVYSTVLTHGAPEVLDKILELHGSVELHEEKERIERSLGCVTDPKMIEKVLNFAMSDKVRSKDKVSLICSVAIHSQLGRDIAWEFVKTNWDKLYEMYKGSFLMTRLIKMTTENFSTEERAVEVREFFEKNPVSAERTVQQSIENILRKSDWWNRDGHSVSDWISRKLAE